MKWKDIDDYVYIGSSLGNAYWSGLDIEDVWKCLMNSTNREEFDAAIEAAIFLKKVVDKTHK